MILIEQREGREGKLAVVGIGISVSKSGTRIGTGLDALLQFSIVFSPDLDRIFATHVRYEP